MKQHYIDTKDIVKDMTVYVTLRHLKQWKVRMWVGIKLIKLAAWIMWVNVEFKGPIPLIYSSITEQPCRCNHCGWSGTVWDCEGDADGDGGLGCPECSTVVEVMA